MNVTILQRLCQERMPVFLGIIVLVLLPLILPTRVDSFSLPKILVPQSRFAFENVDFEKRSRRDFLKKTSILIAGGVPVLSDRTPSNAEDQNILEAREKFLAARKELHDLIENYSEISKGGGDSVRNRLGTQGVNSKLFGIQKVLKTLTDDADDLVEYTETMDEFNAYYFQAEGAAYQSMFVEHSSAKGTPESFLKTAKTDILQMEKYMDQLAVQLKL